jgi:hypothetical protein
MSKTRRIASSCFFLAVMVWATVALAWSAPLLAEDDWISPCTLNPEICEIWHGAGCGGTCIPSETCCVP